MEYMSIQEAAKKWGLRVRQVQNLCKAGRVAGATRFNRSWAIPGNAAKPADRRKFQPAANRPTQTKDKPDFLSNDSRISKQILDKFPYSVSILAPDGTMVYANDAFMAGVFEDVRKNAIGNYNVRDEAQLQSWGIKDHMERALKGEYVYTPNLKHPARELVGTRYSSEYAFVSEYNDLTSFPITDEDNRLVYAVCIAVPVRRYRGRKEILAGKEYIEANYLAPFDIQSAARAANLSASRFSKLFKAESGFSPHEYYIRIKIQKLREKLLENSTSIAQAFNECGLAYNSHYATLFKKHVGLTPTQFRKQNI